MIKIRFVIAIFFTLLSSLNLYKLLTDEGYKGGKVYVVSTVQSIIIQIILIILLIAYTIYLIRLNSKIPDQSVKIVIITLILKMANALNVM